jgi:hypothetical protein
LTSRRRGLRGAVAVSLSAAAIALASCDRDGGNARARASSSRAPRPAAADGSGWPKSEFLETAERLESGGNEFFGLVNIRRLREKLAAPGLSDEMTARLSANLAQELLRTGEIDEAIATIETAVRLARAEPSLRPVISDLLRVRGAIYFRQAEVQNCISRHNPECCMLPLRGGGLHTERTPAERARDSFAESLTLKPGDLRTRWLLNLAYMALGDYPGGVPEAHRIPPSAFESDYDVGRFPDVAAAAGVAMFNLAGGAVVEDLSGDGLLDILTSTADPRGSIAYCVSLGDGRFENRSDASGLSQQLGGLNCTAADYDDDGDFDLFILRGAWLFKEGEIRNSLVRNNGDGTFTDVTYDAGLADPARPTQTAVWGDFDNDGDLDLYVGNESRVAQAPDQDYPNQLFRNEGDGTFTDVAAPAGVTNDRYTKGVAAGDYDNDGDLDLYVSNIRQNRLYRNEGGGTFTDVAPLAGVTEPHGRSFATWFFDFDNDGWLDIFVAAYDAQIEDIAADALGLPHDAPSPCLYRNNGDGTFTDVAAAMGLAHPYLPMGASFGDLDDDGFLDIYLGTGDPNFQTLDPSVMLRNDRGTRFQNVTTSGGFGIIQKGHGIAFADVDNDGDQDVFAQFGGMLQSDRYYNSLFRNPGHGNHSVVVKLVGRKSNRSGHGARLAISLEEPERREIHRAVGSVSSFGGLPARQEIGLGKAERIASLEVWWPASGTRTRHQDLPVDTLIEITEGETEYRVLPLRRFRLP